MGQESVLQRFSPVVRAWFETTFPEPTDAQEQGWRAIADGRHSLILAPTGSGKTLSAFLWSIDKVMNAPVPEKADRCRVLYISPLRALAVDVEKNLRSPLRGIALAAERTGAESVHEPTVGVRSRRHVRPTTETHVSSPILRTFLITTPESLYLMLTSQGEGDPSQRRDRSSSTRSTAVAATKRGTHLAHLARTPRRDLPTTSPQRIGLSATQRPLDEIARFLGGQVDWSPP